MKKHQITVIVIFIVAISYFFYDSIKSVNDFSSSVDFSQKNIDSEDSLIFKNEILKDIEVKKVAKSKLRNTIKFYRYKKEYNLYITKLDLKDNVSIDNVLELNKEVSRQSSSEVYMSLQSNKYYGIKFSGQKINPVSKIYFTYSTDNGKIERTFIKNEFISYYLPLHTFSLKYGEKSNSNDILIESSNSNIFIKKDVPFVISFYKKEKSIYVFLITTIEKSTKINKNISSELIRFN